MRGAVSEWSGCGCGVSYSGLGKSTRMEVGQPFFIGCVHVCVQNFVGGERGTVSLFITIVTRRL